MRSKKQSIKNLEKSIDSISSSTNFMNKNSFNDQKTENNKSQKVKKRQIR